MAQNITIPELTKTEYANCIADSLVQLYNDTMPIDFSSFIFCSSKPSEIKNISLDRTFPLLRLNLASFNSDINMLLDETKSNLEVQKYADEEDDLASYIKSDSDLYSTLEDIFNEAKESYLLNLSDERENERNEGINGAHDLFSLDDSVGDTTQCDRSFTVDIGSRDAAFVYLNGEILVGRASDTHSAIIDKYMNRPIEDKYIRGDEAVGLTGDAKVGFGHIADGIAFIETCDNVSPEEIEEALKKSGDYTKIYSLTDCDKKVTRLARLIK